VKKENILSIAVNEELFHLSFSRTALYNPFTITNKTPIPGYFRG